MPDTDIQEYLTGIRHPVRDSAFLLFPGWDSPSVSVAQVTMYGRLIDRVTSMGHPDSTGRVSRTDLDCTDRISIRISYSTPVPGSTPATDLSVATIGKQLHSQQDVHDGEQRPMDVCTGARLRPRPCPS